MDDVVEEEEWLKQVDEVYDKLVYTKTVDSVDDVR